MSKISIHAQRQALARAIDLQCKVAAGQTVRAQMTKSNEELQLEHLGQVAETLAWLEKHRTSVLMVVEQLRVAEERARNGGPVR